LDGTCDGASIVSCGQWHTIVVASTTNEVYGWGWNKYGQLGPNINNDDDNDDDDNDDDNEVGDHRNRHDDDDINLQSRKRRKQHSNMKCNNSNSRGGGGGDDGDGSSSRRSSHDDNYIHRDEVISHPRCLTNTLRKSIHQYEKRCRIINHDDDHHHDNADNGEDSIEYSIDEVFCGSDYTAIVYNSSVSTSSSIVIM